MSQKIKLGIALYNSRHASTNERHWALAVNATQNKLSGRVAIYQAVQLNEIWSTKHLSGNLTSDAYYYGVVDLGTIRASEDILLDTIERFEATQDGYDTHGRTWSCAWWVIRALRGIEKVYPALKIQGNDVEFYETVVGVLADGMAVDPGPLHLVKA